MTLTKQLTNSDIPRMLELQSQVRPLLGDNQYFLDEMTQEKLEEKLSSKALFFGTEDNGRLIAMARLILPQSEEDKELSANECLIFQPYTIDMVIVEGLSVHPEFRRQGLARQLSITILSFVKSQRFRYVWEHIVDKNTSNSDLAKSLGFKKIGQWVSPTTQNIYCYYVLDLQKFDHLLPH